MWITINYLISVALLGFALWKMPGLSDGSRPQPSWPALRKPLRQCHQKLASLEFFVEWGIADPLALPVTSHGESKQYSTVGELLIWLARARPREPSDYRDIISAFYLFQRTLRLSTRFVTPFVRVTAVELRKLTLFGKPIDRVRIVETGEPVNLGFMKPLCHGSTVSQPMGVAVYSGETVIYKAAVLCR
jgi:hypothetical protein